MSMPSPKAYVMVSLVIDLGAALPRDFLVGR